MTLTRPLSPREQDIAAALGAGMSYAEVADRFGLNRQYVRNVAKEIMRKLPRECRSPAGPIASICAWCRTLGD